ncbi:MAG: O-antigen ligase family protein [Mariprofundaceae bacterium]
MNARLQQLTCGLLCIAALTFPFSVAAANTSLTLALLSGLASGLLWQGMVDLWKNHHTLSLAILTYLLLVLLGLSWSLDRSYGLEVVSHLWLWLLLPLVYMASNDQQWRSRFLLFLSTGLSLHLVLCVIQMNGLIEIDAGGSAAHDATGYIGHISFGIIYSIWAGWLLHYGWLEHGWKRMVPWLLSLWAFAMIFAAQGRSGYLVAIAVLLLVFWKHLLSGQSWKRTAITLCMFTILGIVLISGPGKDRVESTLHGVQAAWQGDLKQVEARWIIWLGGIELWKDHPLLGVGTGGYPEAAKNIRTDHPHLDYHGVNYSHLHNIYLQSLVRWGPVGVIVICALLWLWLRAGIQRPWSVHSNALVSLSAVALIIHGVSSVSLEEHFATILAILALAIGLSDREREETS